MTSAVGCGKPSGGPEAPWVSPKTFYRDASAPGVPVIRVAEVDTVTHDGSLDDAAWSRATEYRDLGLPGGTGLLKFPTGVRFLRTGRVLWVGLDCRVPPGKKGAVPKGAIDTELIEIWIDKGPTRHTFYQIMFKPDGKLQTPWVPKASLERAFRVLTRIAPDNCGYTAEVRIDLDGLADFGEPAGEDVGFNLARGGPGGWSSLAQVVGHVHRPEQFWVLDMTGREKPVPPVNVYREAFKPGADVRAVARSLVEAWARANPPRGSREWARMEVMIDRLRRMLAQDEKDAWGREQEIAILAWRALTGWREQEKRIAVPEAVRALEAQLAEYPGGTFPPTRWREEAYISSFDNTPQPYAIRVPECCDAKRPMPLVMFLHGSGVDHFGGGAIFERYEEEKPCIEVRTKSRQCNWYEPVAMRDVLDVIDDVRSQYEVDPDRIYLTGYSAGAYGVLELGATHPERFAGIVSIAGSLVGRTPETLKNIDVLMAHGVNDYAMGITEATAVMELEMRGTCPGARVQVLPATGHGIAIGGYEPYLLKCRRRAVPDSVACFTDEENPGPARAYWASILALDDADSRGGVRAEVLAPRGKGRTLGWELRVQTANVREFALGIGDLERARGSRPARLVVDGQTLDTPEGEFARLTRPESEFDWRVRGSASRPQADPTAYRAGGILRVYADGSPLIVAPAELMDNAALFSHRGLYGTSSWINIPVRKDTEVTDEELRRHHVILLGSGKLNRVSARLAAMEKDWPLPIADGAVVLDKKRSVPLAQNVVATVTFNPLNRALRCWAIFTDADAGFTPDSPLIRGRWPRRRKPDITVIDLKSNKVVENRLLDLEWKPRPYTMPLD